MSLPNNPTDEQLSILDAVKNTDSNLILKGRTVNERSFTTSEVTSYYQWINRELGGGM